LSSDTATTIKISKIGGIEGNSAIGLVAQGDSGFDQRQWREIDSEDLGTLTCFNKYNWSSGHKTYTEMIVGVAKIDFPSFRVNDSDQSAISQKESYIITDIK